MNHLTKRCGCGQIFALAHLKDRSSQCVACQRRDARGLNEARAAFRRSPAPETMPVPYAWERDVLVHPDFEREYCQPGGNGNPYAGVWRNWSLAGASLSWRADCNVNGSVWVYKRPLESKAEARGIGMQALAVSYLTSYAARLNGHVRRRKGGADEGPTYWYASGHHWRNHATRPRDGIGCVLDSHHQPRL